jgi:hypothetical protein
VRLLIPSRDINLIEERILGETEIGTEKDLSAPGARLTGRTASSK